MPLFPTTKTLSGPLSRRKGAPSNSSRFSVILRSCVALSLVVFFGANVLLLSQYPLLPSSLRSTWKGSSRHQATCSLRVYPPHRYYKLQESSQPSFLTDSSSNYVFGEWPVILPSATPAAKLCVDQSAWYTAPTVPFADGTNPSIITRHRLQTNVPSSASLWQAFPSAAYVATSCLTNGQCSWKDTEQQIQDYRLPSSKQQPAVLQTMFLILDASFHTLAQATITLQRDAQWGRMPLLPQSENHHHTPALDDARLFVHNHQLWVSYREGKEFGYDAQVLNPVRWRVTGRYPNNRKQQQTQLQVWLQASETTSFCCGRNMALMEMRDLNKKSIYSVTSQLQALTWVDPVTVEAVDITPLIQRPTMKRRQKQQHRRLLLDESRNNTHMFSNMTLFDPSHRRLAKPVKQKSHIHGTNAFMVHLIDRPEFLGMGHFHRPPDRAANNYARFGHHYTHCFFTISDQPPYRLTGLSPEFLLPAANATSGQTADDGEIIQFLSGLELDEDTGTVIIAYGINDCEAAVTTVPLSSVRTFLRKTTGDNTQVVDYMKPLIKNTKL